MFPCTGSPEFATFDNGLEAEDLIIRRSGSLAPRHPILRLTARALAAGLGAALLGSTASAQIIIGGSGASNRPAVVVDLSVLDQAISAADPRVMPAATGTAPEPDRQSTRLNSSH